MFRVRFTDRGKGSEAFAPVDCYMISIDGDSELTVCCKVHMGIGAFDD